MDAQQLFDILRFDYVWSQNIIRDHGGYGETVENRIYRLQDDQIMYNKIGLRRLIETEFQQMKQYYQPRHIGDL